ncbi:MAG: menaquinone biosynthesis decarboxylase [Rikenellaceae bacterium]|jgi:4-hydroxy-3-polyprenylbenzoate decarboxylase|nr:menaquinone biosynthesis decarboxylase [Rikenellaceae bacterium]
MYKNLNSYIQALRAADELAVISVPVSSVREMTEITDRVSKQPGGGKALLFTDTGTGFPVLTNLFGSDRRIALALGVERLEELAERLYDLFGQVTSPQKSWRDKIQMVPLLGEAARWLPRRKKGRGACQEVVMNEPDLSKLPILTCWPHDGGRFITLPLVHTCDPETGIRNVGMYRMQVFSDRTTGMHWHLHKTGARHYEAYRALGRRMPVTVCLGGDPAYTYSATAPLPEGIDEYLLAGYIRRRPVELVKCLTNELEVPADCDFVIEGYVDPAEPKAVEGPFGDHTGFYSLPDEYPIFHVTAITHRRGAVYPATIVGIPPQEDLYIGKATEALFLAPIRLAVQPEIRELTLPPAGVMHNIALVNIQKTYPGQAFKTAGALWGAGQMMFNKFCAIIDSEQSVHDPQTLQQAIENVVIPRDVIFSKGPLDVLDHTAPVMGFGGKCAIDATSKETEGLTASPDEVNLPEAWRLTEEICAVQTQFAPDWRTLAVGVKTEAGTEVLSELIADWLTSHGVQGIRFVLVFDADVPLTDPARLLWLVGAHCDAVRDTAVIGDCLLFDARVKAPGINGFNRPWPNPVTMDAETIRLVDRRWAEYGLGVPIASPSLDYLPLIKGDSAVAEL